MDSHGLLLYFFGTTWVCQWMKLVSYPQINGYFIGKITTLAFLSLHVWCFSLRTIKLWRFFSLSVQTATLLQQRQAQNRCVTHTLFLKPSNRGYEISKVGALFMFIHDQTRNIVML